MKPDRLYNAAGKTPPHPGSAHLHLSFCTISLEQKFRYASTSCTKKASKTQDSRQSAEGCPAIFELCFSFPTCGAGAVSAACSRSQVFSSSQTNVFGSALASRVWIESRAEGLTNLDASRCRTFRAVWYFRIVSKAVLTFRSPQHPFAVVVQPMNRKHWW